MKRIISERGAGKTYELIKMADGTDAVIVCLNQTAVKRIVQMASDMGCTITTPITYRMLMEEALRGTHVSGILLDDADVFLKGMSSAKILAIAMTK
jgi:hypothetical protein